MSGKNRQEEDNRTLADMGFEDIAEDIAEIGKQLEERLDKNTGQKNKPIVVPQIEQVGHTYIDGVYQPVGDENFKFKYADYPDVPQRIVDSFNRVGKGMQFNNPTEYYAWIQQYDGKESQKEDTAKYLKERDEEWSKFKSKYQFDDPSGENYIDLENPVTLAKYDVKCIINPYLQESLYDIIFKEQAEEKLEKQAVDNVIANPSDRNERAVEKAYEKLQKKNKQDRVKNPRTKDDKSNTEFRTQRREWNENFESFDKEQELAKSPYDHFELGYMIFKKRLGDDLEIMYTGQGDFGGIEFGFKSDFPMLPGLQPPHGAKFFKSMKWTYRTLMSLLCPLDEKTRKFWFPLFSGDAYKSEISKFVRLIADISRTKTVSISGQLAWKVIPPMEWFSEKVRSINPYDLLSILPKPEADTLLLHIGRTALGSLKKPLDSEAFRNTKLLEVPDFDYDYRTACLIHGDPGTGKSSLFEFIIRGFTSVGYTYDCMGTAFNQFGWDVALNDIVLIDDLDPKSIKSLLTNDKIKTAITNGTMQSEKKGVDGRKIQSAASFYFSTNHIVLPDSFDSGVASRVHMLQTYSKKQLEQRSKQKGVTQFTKEFWLMTAQRLNVPVETLALYLIRCGLDAFVSETDLVKSTDTEGNVTWSVDTTRTATALTPPPNYALRMEANRLRYLFKPPINDKDYLTEAARKAFILTRTVKPDLEVPNEFDDSFNAFTLKLLAETIKNINTRINYLKSVNHTEQKDIDFLKDLATWIEKDKLISTSIWYQYTNLWASNIGENLSLGSSSKLQFEEIWKKMIESVTTIHGAPVEKTRNEYKASFIKQKGDSESFEFELQELMAKHKIELTEDYKKTILNKAVAKYTSFDMTEVL